MTPIVVNYSTTGNNSRVINNAAATITYRAVRRLYRKENDTITLQECRRRRAIRDLIMLPLSAVNTPSRMSQCALATVKNKINPSRPVLKSVIRL